MRNANCGDLDRALESENDELLDAVTRHAVDCRECRERLEIWNGISAAAPDLRRTWESPGLWERIEAAIAADAAVESNSTPRDAVQIGRVPRFGAVLKTGTAGRFRPGGLLKAAMIALVAIPLLTLLVRLVPPDKPGAPGDAFLTGRALAEVEASEAAYVRSIEHLSGLAAAKIENPKSQLFLNYREKLRILDQAIAECRAGVDGNPMNAHLRRELLAMYQEKTKTLEGLVGEGESNVR